MEPERPDQERRHLPAADGIVGAVVAVAAAAGDAVVVELLDPVDGEGRRGRAFDVGEEARAGGRRVARSVLGLEQEHGHLRPGHGIAGTVVARAATGRNALGRKLLDPWGELARAGHVVEDAGAGGRRVGGPVLGLEQEDGHLGACDGVVAAVVAAAASGGDAGAEDLLDVGVEDVRLRHVEEVREESCGKDARDGRSSRRIADRVGHRDVDEPAGRKRGRYCRDLRRANDGHSRRERAAEPDTHGCREAGSGHGDGGAAARGAGAR